MLNEEQAQLKTSLLWQKMNQSFFEPHPSITEVGARREARVVSIINFLFALLSIVGAVFILVVIGEIRSVLVLIALAFIAFAAYVLARTRFYKIGSYMIVWALVFGEFGAGSGNGPAHSLHTYLILAFLLASITFPFRYMVIFAILNNIAIGVMPLINPGFMNVGGSLGLFIPFSLLTLAAMRHRNNVERDRLASSKQLNQELSTLKQELEDKVEQRTIQLDKRARQLQVVTEVARSAASFQDLERLLTSSTRLIAESFGFYHVGIFLLDEEGQYAVLRAANSEGGQRMLNRVHTLSIDLNSIVGYAAKTQSPRIALDTDEDSVYFNNPDLPETRSEMSLPLKVGMRLIGVLDVQSTQRDAFSEDDIAVMGALGDQLAIAIDNTRLLTETRRALVTAEQTHQRYFSQAWSQFSQRLDKKGYRFHDGKLLPLSTKTDEHQTEVKWNSNLSLPLMIRGQNIGFLDIQPIDGKRDWSANELAVLEAAAERAALALESARLLQEAQRRAAKERIISEISAKISETAALDKIMAATVGELRQALGAAEVSIQLNQEMS